MPPTVPSARRRRASSTGSTRRSRWPAALSEEQRARLLEIAAEVPRAPDAHVGDQHQVAAGGPRPMRLGPRLGRPRCTTCQGPPSMLRLEAASASGCRPASAGRCVGCLSRHLQSDARAALELGVREGPGLQVERDGGIVGQCLTCRSGFHVRRLSFIRLGPTRPTTTRMRFDRPGTEGIGGSGSDAGQSKPWGVPRKRWSSEGGRGAARRQQEGRASEDAVQCARGRPLLSPSV